MEDRELAAAYEATNFWVEDAPDGHFCLRCGERSPDLDRLLAAHQLSEWAYVTACNPGSEPLSDGENARRTHELGEWLRGLRLVIFHGKGVGTRGDWPAEPSLLVLGLGEAKAREVGAAFGQKAIVVGRLGEPARLAWIGASTA
jgi:hypothetical protein